MTIDISGIARIICRMDASATLKNFVAVFVILTVPVYLGAIYIFIVSLIEFGFDLREPTGAVFIAAGVMSAVVAAFSPLLFILWDWIDRQPWRMWAAINGGLLGAILFAALGAAIGITMDFEFAEFRDLGLINRAIIRLFIISIWALLVAWLVVESKSARRKLIWICGVIAVFVVLAFMIGVVFEATDGEGAWIAAIELLPRLFGGIALLSYIVWLFARVIRNRIVLSGSSPRGLLLGAFYRKGFWIRLAFLAGLPSSLWHAAAMKTPAFWAFLLARPMVYAGLFLLLGEPWVTIGIKAQVLVATILLIGGHMLFWFAKRLATSYSWDPERSPDMRPPVLFLRSFEDDQLEFHRPWWNLIGRWLDLWSFRTNADQAMIDEIAQYGPVVALGMPGEKKIPFGAQRYYSTHDDWQDIVTRTAKSAQAIVIAAGDTPGVRWEYELLARENLLDRTLLLFAPSADKESTANISALTAFLEAQNVKSTYEVQPGEKIIALLPRAGSTPVLLTAEKATASAYITAVRGFFQHCSVAELSDQLAV